MTKPLNRMRSAVVAAMTAIAVIGASAAEAAGTDAGTQVSNTFTLNYQVGGVSQTQIDNTGSPTLFTVDRLVDLTVSNVDLNGGSAGDVGVSPLENGAELVFGVRNIGNDNQAYALSLEDLGGDDFDAGSLSARFYTDAGADNTFTPGVDDSGGGTAYTLGVGNATADVAPDTTIWVVISGNIPDSLSDGDTDGVILLADTLNPVTSLDASYSATAGTPAAAAGSNSITGEADNVLADGTGTAAADAANDGAHSATSTFVVAAADLTASKAVTVIATDASAIDCSTDPALVGEQYAVPGACVEYVITASNSATASATATAINIADTLPDEVAFVSAVGSGFTAAGSLTTPPGGCASSCSVSLTGASLDPNTTGTLTIRATVR